MKHITEITNEDELREYLKVEQIKIIELNAQLKNDIEKAKTDYNDNIFYIKSVEDLKDLDDQSIYYYIQTIQFLATDADWDAQKKVERLLSRIDTRLMHIPDVWDAMQIQKHWAIFNRHLEKNPTLKEEWDALCMGIKLTEDFEDDKKN